MEYRRGPDMGGGIGGLLHTLRDGVAKYNLGNGRGDIVAQSDHLGVLTWTASYEAFGKREEETGSNNDRQRANSKEEDPTGLLWEHFRYRDLETGVWLSRDPAGFVDGPNLYAYVRQNPWTFFDPLGLQTSERKAQMEKAKAGLSIIPAPLRLAAAKKRADLEIKQKMDSGGVKGVRSWIVKEANFTARLPLKMLDNYLGTDGKQDPKVTLSQRDVYEAGVSLRLDRSPEFLADLKRNTGAEKKTWKGSWDILAGADTSGTLGTFTAKVNAEITSQMVNGKPAWIATGTFSVQDTYDFNVNDAEAARAINDFVAGVDKGPYEGRSQMGQLKTLTMSRVPGKPFDVTSDPVKFRQTSLEKTAEIETTAGKYQSENEYK